MTAAATTGGRLNKFDSGEAVTIPLERAREAILLQTKQRMARMLGTGRQNGSDGSSCPPPDAATPTKSIESLGSNSTRATEDSESGMSATADELQSETRKCRSRLADAEVEMKELHDQRSKTLRTGRMPGDGPQAARRKYLSTCDGLLQELKAELREVTNRLAAKKRALCALCRDEENLESLPDMYSAQEEYDEALLRLQEKQDECSLLRLEHECSWLTDNDGVVTYLEQVQHRVDKKEKELKQICELERDTMSRGKRGGARASASDRHDSSSSRDFSANSRPISVPSDPVPSTDSSRSGASTAEVVDAAASRTAYLGSNGRPVGSAETSMTRHLDTAALVQEPLLTQTKTAPARTPNVHQFPAAGDHGDLPGGAKEPLELSRKARDRRGSADAGVLARARAMLEKREGKSS